MVPEGESYSYSFDEEANTAEFKIQFVTPNEADWKIFNDYLADFELALEKLVDEYLNFYRDG